jgi:hypothetical protein
MAKALTNRIVKLNKIIPALFARYTDSGSWSGLTNGWQNYSRLGIDIPYWQSFIDLAGYTRQNNLTFFTPQSDKVEHLLTTSLLR